MPACKRAKPWPTPTRQPVYKRALVHFQLDSLSVSSNSLLTDSKYAPRYLPRISLACLLLIASMAKSFLS